MEVCTNLKWHDWNMVHNLTKSASLLDIIVNMNGQTNCHHYRTGYWSACFAMGIIEIYFVDLNEVMITKV
jgi:hypothetical protein